MWRHASATTVYLAFLLQCVGLLWFSKGFFPQKKVVLTGYGTIDVEDGPAIFDRLVFVVIDALRSDFIFGPQSAMHHMHDMINEQALIPFTGKASTPTVTLPRLKCLTTGAITGFLDAILNIAESDTSSTVAFQDSWVQQMVNQNRKIHMYGDDTWMRLFPQAFTTFEGTSSFFVKDFTEVDNNVTRHLAQELKSDAWDTLILHYLGLDHIGHLEGPASQHMSPKQIEMDNILHDIYEASNKADKARSGRTLTILLGDHGMTGDGNHGGASETEASTGIAFLSPLFQKAKRQSEIHWPPENIEEHSLELYHNIMQSDVVPALSLALGLPIPINSLGVIPEPILSLWNISDQRKILLQNARQLQRLIKAGQHTTNRVDTFLPCQSVLQQGKCNLADIEFRLASMDLAATNDFQTELYKIMRLMQQELLSASNNFDVSTMHVGLLMLMLALFSALLQLRFLSFVHHNYLTLLIPVFHSLTAFASSFVEEEHVYWYYVGVASLFFLSLGKIRRHVSASAMASAASSMLAFRILRRYNQTGQKFAGAPDIASYLDHFKYFTPVSLFLVAAMSIKDMLKRFSREPVQSTVSNTASIAIIVFRMSQGQYSIIAVRIAWALILLLIGINCFTKRDRRTDGKYESVANLLFLLQARPQNYLVLPLFRTINSFLREDHDTKWTITMYLILEQVSFFALGNSNALSGLDLSQAYNGVTEYDELTVGCLFFISSFIGPIYWHLQLLSFLDRSDAESRGQQGGRARTGHELDARGTARSYVTIFSVMYATALATSCYALRHHLFVFSVFSPKLLFTGAWTVFNGLALLTI